MTSLKITPNFEKKTAKFEGTIAGGERVRVEISDVNKYIGGLNSLRLRNSLLKIQKTHGCKKLERLYVNLISIQISYLKRFLQPQEQ